MFVNTHCFITSNPLRQAFTNIRLLVRLGLFVLVTTVPAFGQMGSFTIYSNPNAPRFVGCGITQDNYNSYRHTYWVKTTLTSPHGRTATVTSIKSSAYNAYVRAEPSLSWDWVNEVGVFFTSSTHTGCCPYMGGDPNTGQNCSFGGTTTAQRETGVSFAYYTLKDEFVEFCSYQKIPDCDVTCAPQSISAGKVSDGSCPRNQLRLQPWIAPTLTGRFCLPLFSTLISVISTEQCRDQTN
jgi:hypothetical protein